MVNTSDANNVGLDMAATGLKIARLINESGMSDKELGEKMHLTVQSIHKWRHGKNLPDIENMYNLSRILGVKVDDFLVPVTLDDKIFYYEAGVCHDTGIFVRRMMEYSTRIYQLGFLNHALNDSVA